MSSLWRQGHRPQGAAVPGTANRAHGLKPVFLVTEVPQCRLVMQRSGSGQTMPEVWMYATRQLKFLPNAKTNDEKTAPPAF